MKGVVSLFGAAVLVVVLLLAVAVSPIAAKAYPPIIPLPDGFAPEGVVVGKGHTIYAGSLADGSVYQADLRTGDGSILIPGQGGTVVGLAFDERTGYLYAAGGPTDLIYVFNTATGETVETYEVADAGFINDAVVTREAVYFTDSFVPRLYKLPLPAGGHLSAGGDVEIVALGGDFDFVPNAFNANGIEATANGKYLLVVNSTLGTLYRVDAETGEAAQIDLGGDSLTSGDGILLVGHTLYVVRNSLNQIAVVHLGPDYVTGEVVDTITDPAFDVPTTVARFGSRLYAVNARFGTEVTPETEYDIVQVSARP